MSNPYLSRARLKGYRNIRDTEATFENGLNIIIGPNGCGKSNFLWLLGHIDSEKINDLDVKGNIEYYYKGNLVRTNITFEFNQHYNFNIKRNIESEILNHTNKKDSKNIEEVIKNSSSLFLKYCYLPFNVPSEIECFSTPTTTSYLIVEGLNSLINFNSNKNLILTNLINLSDWLKEDIMIQDFQIDQKYIDTLKKYTPIENIQVEYPIREDEIKVEKGYNNNKVTVSNLMYGFKTKNEWFKWNELSDGTRRMVWIVLSVLATNNVVLLEEPELGIHPHQLQLLMEFLKEQSAEKQIIITTHAPEVLNILDENELSRIKLARYDETLKSTVIESVSEKKQAAIKKYFAKTGLLSSYWVNIGLENKK